MARRRGIFNETFPVPKKIGILRSYSDCPAVEVVIERTRIRKSESFASVNPHVPQGRIGRKYIAGDFLAQRNSASLPTGKERPGRAQKNVRIEIPDILAALRLIRQKTEHKLRFELG